MSSTARNQGFMPGTLWSPADMERFRAGSYGLALSMLQRCMAFVAGTEFAGAKSPAEDGKLIGNQVKECKDAINELPMSEVLRGQFSRLLRRAEAEADGDELTVMLREFYNNLLHEMATPWFLMIRTERRELYEQSQPPFGANVASAFPEAAQDIAAACRCYALDEWTACVFHCMRALEHGLRAMGREVGLDQEAMKLENWKNVIDQIEKKIAAMESLPRSPEKGERLRVLSAAATDFRYFKDAWRNHVSHSRVHYDEREASKVLNHVRSFMEQAAPPDPWAALEAK